MRVVFYSQQCNYCIKLIEYLEKHNIKSLFKMINIDVTEAPKEIDIVPTIIDTELNQPLKGKKAFEYLLNIKYFNNPTNNVDLVKLLPTNPNIKEYEKAYDKNVEKVSGNLEINSDTVFKVNKIEKIGEQFKDTNIYTLYEENKQNDIVKSSQDMAKLRQIQDKKLEALIKMRGKII